MESPESDSTQLAVVRTRALAPGCRSLWRKCQLDLADLERPLDRSPPVPVLVLMQFGPRELASHLLANECSIAGVLRDWLNHYRRFAAVESLCQRTSAGTFLRRPNLVADRCKRTSLRSSAQGLIAYRVCAHNSGIWRGTSSLKTLVKVVLGLIGTSCLIILAHIAIIEVGRDVVTLRTLNADGTTQETRLWIVEHDGDLWLHSKGDAWEQRFQHNSAVEVVRAGVAGRYFAQPDRSQHLVVDQALRRKYGLADRWVRFLAPCDDSVLPVRLFKHPSAQSLQIRSASTSS